MTTLSLVPTPALLQELERRQAAPRTSASKPEGAEDPTRPKLPPLVAAALQVVERIFQIPVEEVLGHCREEHLVKARFAAWMLLADQGMTRREIARAFRRQDVGTIRHGCLRGREMVQKDKSFARAMWDAYHGLERRAERLTRHPRAGAYATEQPAPAVPA